MYENLWIKVEFHRQSKSHITDKARHGISSPLFMGRWVFHHPQGSQSPSHLKVTWKEKHPHPSSSPSPLPKALMLCKCCSEVTKHPHIINMAFSTNPKQKIRNEGGLAGRCFHYFFTSHYHTLILISDRFN